MQDNPNGPRARRDRSKCPHLRLVDSDPPRNPDEIAKSCLQIALVARACAVDAGLTSAHGEWFASLAVVLEREADLLTSEEE